MITRKRCVLCNHERREDIERMLEDMSLSPDEVDREYNWPSGTTSKHQRNHMTGYSKSSNPRCVICTSEGRSELEVRLHEGSVTPDDVANLLGCSKNQVVIHMKDHLQPLVQKSAANLIAVKEVDEIELLSNNIEFFL